MRRAKLKMAALDATSQRLDKSSILAVCCRLGGMFTMAWCDNYTWYRSSGDRFVDSNSVRVGLVAGLVVMNLVSMMTPVQVDVDRTVSESVGQSTSCGVNIRSERSTFHGLGDFFPKPSFRPITYSINIH